MTLNRIDLAISSDLKRARQTGEAIVENNETVEELLEWRVVRERCLGDVEFVSEAFEDLRAAERAVAVQDRESLTRRPPNGESVVDLRNRVRMFLDMLMAEVRKLERKDPTIVVASHGMFMKELYYCLVSSRGKAMAREAPHHGNTSIAQYRISYAVDSGGVGVVVGADCEIRTCARHLTTPGYTHRISRVKTK